MNTSKSESGFQMAEEIGKEIWRLSQDNLAVRYPFFRTFLFAFTFCAQEDAKLPGTDGTVIYYDPQTLVKVYRHSSKDVEHALMHMLFHRMFLHIVQKPQEDPMLWDLACDLAAERLLQEERVEVRPQQIYRELSEQHLEAEELERRKEQYQRDDHSFWKKADKETLLMQLQDEWNQLASKDGSEGTGNTGGRGQSAGTLAEKILLQRKKTYDFRKYLRRFAVTREEMKTDMESFDYIPYLYGLARYGNLPLIEHLEYQEVHKLEELVIAIDTSGSCKTDTIRRFMDETYGILSDRENFFDRMNVYVIQADFCVQHVAHITSEAEWNTYLEQLTIHGRSGTDFRPVFAYVEQLREKKELKNLKGLLYFTDGDGIYPESPTDYETAFVFYQEKAQHQKVPSWAVELKLEGECNEH
jgi:predicted metal-dependent peptidase